MADPDKPATPPRILVVEPDRLYGILVCLALEEAGDLVTVHHAGCEAALDWLEAGGSAEAALVAPRPSDGMYPWLAGELARRGIRMVLHAGQPGRDALAEDPPRVGKPECVLALADAVRARLPPPAPAHRAA